MGSKFPDLAAGHTLSCCKILWTFWGKLSAVEASGEDRGGKWRVGRKVAREEVL